MYPVLRSCFFFFFFFNDTATTEIYTLSLHDALPIFLDVDLDHLPGNFRGDRGPPPRDDVARGIEHRGLRAGRDRKSTRLNSSHLGISYAVFCLKKKKKKDQSETTAFHKQHRRPSGSC